jgi:hypothetical protein
MILFYVLMVLALGLLQSLVKRRAGALSRRYVAMASAVQEKLREATQKPGNGGRADPCLAAVQQIQLALLVQKRDQVEAKHFAWQHAADRLAHWGSRLREWQGRKLPYLFGVVDVCLMMMLMQHLSVADASNVKELRQVASTWMFGAKE